MAVTTHIDKREQMFFAAMTSGKIPALGLFSCFVDGEPSTAIVLMEKEKVNGVVMYKITPLYVRVTDGMVLTDHEGQVCDDTGGAGDN